MIANTSLPWYIWLMSLGMFVTLCLLSFRLLRGIFGGIRRAGSHYERQVVTMPVSIPAPPPAPTSTSKTASWEVRSLTGFCPKCGGDLVKKSRDLRAGYYIQRWRCTSCHHDTVQPSSKPNRVYVSPTSSKIETKKSRGIVVEESSLKEWLRSNPELRKANGLR